MKLVINKCYGGFSISKEAKELLGGSDISRDDERLIKLIEERGTEFVSGKHANLKIVEIPDDVQWEIQDYDGIEWIAETHRKWS